MKIGSRSDNTVSRTEELMLEVLRDRLGAETYTELALHVDRHIVDQASLRRLLQSVTRPEARELILGTAQADPVGRDRELGRRSRAQPGVRDLESAA